MIGKWWAMFILVLGTLLFLVLVWGCGQSSSGGGTQTRKFDVPDLSNWRKEDGVRVAGMVSPSTIRLSNGNYRIFYPDGGIKSALSADGLLFTVEAGTRITTGYSSWEDGVKDPDIVTESGYYRMYYTGIGTDGKHRVFSATSTDGFLFTREAGVRVNYDASYNQLADVPSAVKVGSNNYKMYFVYDWYGDNSIKGATSTDGLSWEVRTLSGFVRDCMDPEVIMDGSTIVMFFAAPRYTQNRQPMDIYKATSTNGLTWEVVGRALIPAKAEEGEVIGDPDVIQLPNSTYRMYYYGYTGGDNYNILSATAESL